jgi:DNA-binding response OmpR family regulator
MKAPTGKTSKKAQAQQRSKGLILVVEDDRDSQEVLAMILESLGYETLCLDNGENVLEKIKDKPIILAMLDIMMPKVDGYKVLELLRESEQFEDLPVFMVTAKNEDEDVLAGYKHGADYYIMKPFSSKQIEYGLRLFLEKDQNDEDTSNP